MTPEQCIPPEPLFVPWESCITLGSAFSYRYGDHYKSPREVVGLLLEIVSKGGNLALNIAPQPDGRLPFGAVKVLQTFGPWMKIHGEGIYDTRPLAPYIKDQFYFTKNRKTGSVYAFYYVKSSADIKRTYRIPWNGSVSRIIWLETGESVNAIFENDAIDVTLPYPADPDSITITFRLS